MKVLVDTSIWSLAFRRKSQHLNSNERMLVTELAALIDEGRASIIGLVRQELLSGVKTEAQFENLRKMLRAFPDEPLEPEDHETAAKFSNSCVAKGIAVSLTDLLICAVADRREMYVFTSDLDFKRYLDAIPLKLYPVRTQTN